MQDLLLYYGQKLLREKYQKFGGNTNAVPPTPEWGGGGGGAGMYIGVYMFMYVFRTYTVYDTISEYLVHKYEGINSELQYMS